MDGGKGRGEAGREVVRWRKRATRQAMADDEAFLCRAEGGRRSSRITAPPLSRTKSDLLAADGQERRDRALTLGEATSVASRECSYSPSRLTYADSPVCYRPRPSERFLPVAFEEASDNKEECKSVSIDAGRRVASWCKNRESERGTKAQVKRRT